MFRSLLFVGSLVSLLATAEAADQSPSEQAISKAITVLQAERESVKDPAERAKIDKVLRDLQLLVTEADVKPAKIDFDVKPAVLKKKFNGKSAFNAKTGELTLTYDFGKKTQLGDFDANQGKIQLVQDSAVIESADKLTHIAKFRTFTVSAVMLVKSMRGCGISSSNGSLMKTGITAGFTPNGLYLEIPEAEAAWKTVGKDVLTGNIPVSFSVTPVKTSAKYGNETLAAPTIRKDDVHQIILVGGPEGSAFSKLVIVGTPDPTWFKEFLGE